MRLIVIGILVGLMPIICADPLQVDGMSEQRFTEQSTEALCELMEDCGFFNSASECIESFESEPIDMCNFDEAAARACIQEIEDLSCDDLMSGQTALLMPSCALVSGC